jgi:Asp-tRNA(Asn)/Glu-tRNA(Gln) amidotransferase A subunit family amidase
LITRAGVIPISYTQDTVGPIARNVKDLALALTVLASIGFDSNDNVTALAPPEAIGKDYAAEICGGSLKGLRLGVLNGFYNHTSSVETTPVNDAMGQMIGFLQAQGVEIVNVTEAIYNATDISARLDVQTSEYRQQLDVYLAGASLNGSGPKSFNELYTSSKFLVIPSQYSYIKTAFVSSTSNASYAVAKLGIQNLTTALLNTFSENRLDAVIYPEQKNLVVKIGSPSQSGRNGILAALTGSPVVTVPVGFSPPSEDAPLGVPIGMEILGLPFTEGKLLNMAAHITQGHPIRRMPSFANQSVETRNYVDVPVIRPNASNIPPQYPIGVLS